MVITLFLFKRGAMHRDGETILDLFFNCLFDKRSIFEITVNRLMFRSLWRETWSEIRNFSKMIYFSPLYLIIALTISNYSHMISVLIKMKLLMTCWIRCMMKYYHIVILFHRKEFFLKRGMKYSIKINSNAMGNPFTNACILEWVNVRNGLMRDRNVTNFWTKIKNFWKFSLRIFRYLYTLKYQYNQFSIYKWFRHAISIQLLYKGILRIKFIQ